MEVNDFLRAEAAAGGAGAVETLRLGASAQNHVNAYLEYVRIVGDADGGKLLSEDEYAEFRLVKAAAARANRLYLTWRCAATGVDCKSVGPSSMCFCGHRYKQHVTDNVTGKQRFETDVRCAVAGCPCDRFEYLPSHGTWAIKCACKHAHDEHDPRTRRCRRCTGCTGFTSSYSCACGSGYAAHATVVETRAEREAAGRPVDNLTGGGAAYEALGGVTDFASLADGVDRPQRELPFTRAAGRLQREAPAQAARLMAAADTPTADERGAAGAGGTGVASSLARLKEQRRGGAGRGAGKDPPAEPGRTLSAAEQYAAKKRAAMERAAQIKAEREAARAAAEQEELAGMSELDQLHRLSLRRR